MMRAAELWIFDLARGQSSIVARDDARYDDYDRLGEHLVWSPDDALLGVVTTSGPGSHAFELWDTRSMTRVTKQHAQRGVAPTFTRDGAVVAFTGRLGDPDDQNAYPDRPTLALFDVKSGRVLGAITVEPPASGSKEDDVWHHSGEPWPRRVVFSPSLSSVAVLWSLDEAAVLWDLVHSRQIVLAAKGVATDGMVVSPDGRWLLWGQGNGVGRWDLAAGRSAPRLPFPSGVVALAVRPTRPELAVLTSDLSLSLWDIATQRQVWTRPLLTALAQEVSGFVEPEDVRVRFSPRDGRVIVDHEHRYIVDAKSGAILEQGDLRPNVPTGAPTSEDGSRFVSFDRATGEVAWTDVESRERHVLCRQTPSGSFVRPGGS